MAKLAILEPAILGVFMENARVASATVIQAGREHPVRILGVLIAALDMALVWMVRVSVIRGLLGFRVPTLHALTSATGTGIA